MDAIHVEYYRSVLCNTEERISLYDRLIEMTPGKEWFREARATAIRIREYVQSECIRLGYGELIDGEFRLREGK